MITVFSSNIDGGMLQYAVMLFSEMIKLGKDCRLMIPENSRVTIPRELSGRVIHYEKVKTVNAKDKRIRMLSEKVLETGPELVWYAESTIVSAQVCCALKGRVRQFITVHDPAADHPTHNASLKYRMKKWLEHRMRARSMEAADKILVPSEESFQKYARFEPQHKDKTEVFRLGALLPQAKELPVPELGGEKDYFLFFGRIDKYKGIGNLLEAYEKYKVPDNWLTKNGSEKACGESQQGIRGRGLSDGAEDNRDKKDISENGGKLRLVIAGKGGFSEEEKQLLARQPDVIVVNRYIEDGEMLALFGGAAVSVLPYIEASQSGVLPISYQFGVPVIVSGEKGLTQFVEEGRTGFIAKDVEALAGAMEQMQHADRAAFRQSCLDYYAKYLEWGNNLRRLL